MKKAMAAKQLVAILISVVVLIILLTWWASLRDQGVGLLENLMGLF